MLSAKEYRELADECLDWAETAKSDRECKIFLQMAEAWLEVAARAEAKNDKNDPNRTTERAGAHE